jgi:Protein of unknown function (DUF2911)
MKKITFIAFVILVLSFSVFAQLSLPRESNKQEVSQTVGDTKINIVYFRPNTQRAQSAKPRVVFGCETKDVIPVGGTQYPCLVPYGQVWRTGANDNTTFEVTNDVSINGQSLPKGKYGLHTIPNKKEWIIIFSKVSDAWGSFAYDEKKDALRVKVAPMKSEMNETMSISFGDVATNNAGIAIAFDKVKVGFSVNVGDISSRVMSYIRTTIETRKADDVRPLNQGTNYVIGSKLKDNYTEAMTWIEKSIATKATYGNLTAKARLLNEMGNMQEAILTGEMAVNIGKSSTPAVDTTSFEKTLAEWKAKK